MSDAAGRRRDGAVRTPIEIGVRLERNSNGLIESKLEYPRQKPVPNAPGTALTADCYRALTHDLTLSDVQTGWIADAMLPTPAYRKRFRKIVEANTESKGEVRVVVRTDSGDGPDLDAIPWEAGLYRMLDRLTDRSARVSMVRRTRDRSNRRERRLFAEPVLRFVAADAHGTDPDAPITLKPLRSRDIKRLGHEAVAVLHDLHSAQGPFEEQELSDERPFDVFHFSGHGTPEGLIVGEPAQLTAGFLSDRLGDHGARLAVLIACDSASNRVGETGDARPGGAGVAVQVSARVPAVIGMQREILDRDADVFVDELYQGLQAGGSLDRAVAAARDLLHDDDRPFWIPVLHLAAGIEDTEVPRAGSATVETQPVPAARPEPLAVADADRPQLLEPDRSGAIRLIPLPSVIPEPAATALVLSGDGVVAATSSARGLRVHWAPSYASGGPAIAPGGLAARRVLAVRRLHATMVQVLVATDERLLSVTRRTDGSWAEPAVLLDEPGITGAAYTDHDVLVVDAAGRLSGVHGGFADHGGLRTVAGVEAAIAGGGTVVATWGTAATGRRAFAVQRLTSAHPEVLLQREEDVLAVGVVRPVRATAGAPGVTVAVLTPDGVRLETMGARWTARP